jgi:hypothetical protein
MPYQFAFGRVILINSLYFNIRCFRWWELWTEEIQINFAFFYKIVCKNRKGFIPLNGMSFRLSIEKRGSLIHVQVIYGFYETFSTSSPTGSTYIKHYLSEFETVNHNSVFIVYWMLWILMTGWCAIKCLSN